MLPGERPVLHLPPHPSSFSGPRLPAPACLGAGVGPLVQNPKPQLQHLLGQVVTWALLPGTCLRQGQGGEPAVPAPSNSGTGGSALWPPWALQPTALGPDSRPSSGHCPGGDPAPRATFWSPGRALPREVSAWRVLGDGATRERGPGRLVRGHLLEAVLAPWWLWDWLSLVGSTQAVPGRWGPGTGASGSGLASRGDTHLAKVVCILPVLRGDLLRGRTRDAEEPRRPPDLANPQRSQTDKDRQTRYFLPPSSVLSPRSPPRSLPDSRGRCDGPWSPAACGPRGPWWTRPGCAYTLCGHSGVSTRILDIPQRPHSSSPHLSAAPPAPRWAVQTRQLCASLGHNRKPGPGAQGRPRRCYTRKGMTA